MSSSIGKNDFSSQNSLELVTGLDNLVNHRNRSERKSESMKKIGALLKQVDSNFSSFNREQLSKINTLISSAKEKHLLPESAKDVAKKVSEFGVSLKGKTTLYTADRNLTIMTRDGEVQVNRDLLNEKSEAFKALTTRWKDPKKPVDFSKYSRDAIEILVRLLHSQNVIKDLPKDERLVYELVDLALAYDFADLITNLKPAVNNFLESQPHLENMDDFLVLLKEHAQNPTVKTWLSSITKKVLEDFEIKSDISDSGNFIIPLERIGMFFNADTKKLFEGLPVSIKNDEKEVQLGEINFSNFDDIFKLLPSYDRDRDSVIRKIIAERIESGDDDTAIQFAKKLGPKNRDKILYNEIDKRVSTNDFDGAIKFANALSHYEQEEVFKEIALKITSKGDFDKAIIFANDIPEDFKMDAFEIIAREMANRGKYDQALKLVKEILVENKDSDILIHIPAIMAKRGDFDRAINFANDIPNNMKKSEALREIAREIGKQDHPRAIALAQTIPNPEIRNSALNRLR